jgi:DNA-binding transcriptional ArsR family regulator
MTDEADDHLLSALNHPLRRQILRKLLAQNPISPRQISEELHAPLSNVSYHVRVLADCGAVVLVDTEPARGSIRHLYRPEVDQGWALAVLGQVEDETDVA